MLNLSRGFTIPDGLWRPPVYLEVDDPDPSNAQIVPLVAFSDDGWVSPHGGTALILNPGLLLTARHVVQAILDDLRDLVDVDPRDPSLDLIRQAKLYFCVGAGTEAMTPYPVRSLRLSQTSDLAILSSGRTLIDNGGIPNIAAACTLAIPQLDRKVFTFGFPRTEVAVDDEGIVARVHQAWSSGRVLQHFPSGRDRGLFPWPGFRTSLRTDGGMSGGPVIDEHGHVCGVVSAGADYATEGGAEHETLVAALWPMLPIEVLVAPGVHRTMQQLCRDGELHIHGWQDVDADEDGGGVNQRHTDRYWP